jgi:hypothetical protein
MKYKIVPLFFDRFFYQILISRCHLNRQNNFKKVSTTTKIHSLSLSLVGTTSPASKDLLALSEHVQVHLREEWNVRKHDDPQEVKV